MRRFVPALALLGACASPLAAQLAPRTLVVDRPVSDSLASDGVHPFTLELRANQFVLGAVDQRTMDVVVTIKAPDGSTVRRIDVSARGPEPFQFESEAAGRYTIELTPFEEQTGRYTLEVTRVERIATRPADRVDQVMGTYADAATPGVVVGVVRAGEVAFSRAYGAADLTHAVPFRVDTRTNIGSTSKQFTAFAIHLLAQRGLLSLDDDVREHIPELPELGDTVRIRHLLTHTSGYREFLNTLALTGRRIDTGDWIDRSEIIRLVQRQPALQNEPGAEWNYNNTAFSLLAQIVERVGGDDYPAWMRENVFEPLGMRNTVVREHPAAIVRNSAQGYAPTEQGGWQEAPDLAGAMGAGGIYTTVGDLALWMRNFRRVQLGAPGFFDAMTTRFVLNDGDTTDYGHGLFVDEYRGLRRVHHGGADIAHRSQFLYFPELDAGVVVLSNNATANVGLLADQVVDAFFAERLAPREEETEAAAAGEPFDPANFDVTDFESLVGRYALVEMPAFVLSFEIEGDTIYTQATGQPRIPIFPTSDSTFELRVVDASLTFHRGPDGGADSLTLHQNGAHVARRLPGEEWEPDAAALREYTGRFYSPELETFYVIDLEEERLVARHPRFEETVKLTPGSERDRFAGTFPIAELEFVRNEAGEVFGFEAANGRTRDVRFWRTDADDPRWTP